MSPTFFRYFCFDFFMGHHSQQLLWGTTPKTTFMGSLLPIFLHTTFMGSPLPFFYTTTTHNFYGVITPIFYTTSGLPIPIQTLFMGSSLPFSTQLWGYQSQSNLLLWGHHSHFLHNFGVPNPKSNSLFYGVVNPKF